MTRRFGIEIEAIGMSCDEVARLLNENGIACRNPGYTHQMRDQWKVVTDASVYGGFEVVSPPLQGHEGIEEVKKVVNLLNEAGADVNRKCGIHVHIEMRDESSETIANVYNRYRKFEEKIDRFMPNSRRSSNNQYCKSLRNLGQLQVKRTATQTCHQRTDRYYKVNLTSFVKYGTIEFRHHSGSLNATKIANWIQFLQQFVEASSQQRQHVVANNVQCDLRGKSKAIVELLATRPLGITAEEIATRVGTTKASVQSIVCRLRKVHGYHISTGRRYQLLAGATTSGHVETEVDTVFRGVNEHLSNYYNRRAAVLAA